MPHVPGVTLAAALTLLALTSCGNRVRCDYYDFDFQKPVDYPQLVFRSSTIVVGTVKAVAITRSGIPARKTPELLLDETQVDVEVENVLRGDWQKPRLRFYFFGFSAKNRGGYTGPALYRVAVGERRLFFLTTDSGEFRSAADVRGDYSVRVWSGQHRNFHRSEAAKDSVLGALDSTAVGDDISAILLELGEGPEVDALAVTLGWAEIVSGQLTRRKRIAARLAELTAEHQERRLRLQACKILAEQYAGQSGCLYVLQNEPSLSPDERQQVETMLANRRRWDVQLKNGLRTQPMYAFHLDSVTAVRDELELLVGDPDAELRQLACTIFRQNYPGDLNGCSHPH